MTAVTSQVGTSKGLIRVFDSETRSRIGTLTGHTGGVYCLVQVTATVALMLLDLALLSPTPLLCLMLLSLTLLSLILLSLTLLSPALLLSHADVCCCVCVFLLNPNLWHAH